MKPKPAFVSSLVFFSLLISTSVFSATIPVDMRVFYADPTVSVSADGTSAVMAEDEFAPTVYLANDPYSFGDPGFVIPVNTLSLNFHLSFVEPDFNDDTFLATLMDGNTGDVIDDFYIDFSWDGDVSFDLTGLPSSVTLLGLEFQLNAWDFELDSTATITDLVFLTQDTGNTNPPTVPEPGTFLLFSAGIASLAVVGKKRQK